MTPREAKQRLSEIRFRYNHCEIEADEAYKLAEEPLKVYNEFAVKTAKKYGVRPATIKNNIIYW